ncbi:MAG: acyl carrier protein [Calditrichaeota bacterium]|nr:acyl carrier protein [Calditrichota bacterium]
MNAILVRQGKNPVDDEQVTLRDIGFRSLDFSELALRVEKRIGRELIFDASILRGITSVADALDFFEEASRRA